MAHYTYHCINRQGERITWTYGPMMFTLNGKDVEDSTIFNVLVNTHTDRRQPVKTSFPEFWASVMKVDPVIYAFLQERLDDYDLVWQDILVGYEPIAWLRALWWKMMLPYPDEGSDSVLTCEYLGYEDVLELHALRIRCGHEEMTINHHGMVLKSEMTLETTALLRDTMHPFLRAIDWEWLTSEDPMLCQAMSSWCQHWGANPSSRSALLAHITSSIETRLPLEWTSMPAYEESPVLL